MRNEIKTTETAVSPATVIDGCVEMTDYPCAIEPKIDGFRCMAIICGGAVELRSRAGNQFYIPHIEAAVLVLQTGDGIFDGELFAGSFEATQSAVAAGDESVCYNIFDVIINQQWADRKAQLSKMNFVSGATQLVPHRICRNESEFEKFHAVNLAAGYEGSVVKNLAAGYDDFAAMQRFKPVRTYDLPVVAVNENSRGNEIKNLVVEMNGVQTRVGVGFSAPERILFWMEREKIIGSVVEVAADRLTARGALRFPRFVRMRPDKKSEII